jgi:hypothetical protein
MVESIADPAGGLSRGGATVSESGEEFDAAYWPRTKRKGSKMGAASWATEEMRFTDLNGAQTECYVFVSAAGDYPIQVPGWYHRSFPATMSVLDILNGIQQGTVPGVLEWDRGAPKP